MINVLDTYASKIDFSLADLPSKASSAQRPSSKRECAIRNTLAGLPCMTCGHAVDWSRATGQHGHAGAASLGHVIARECWVKGGGYVAGNIGAQCRTCQYDAKRLGLRDLSAYIIPGTVPESFLSQSASDNGPDVRDCEPDGFPATAARRKADRFARWGW